MGGIRFRRYIQSGGGEHVNCRGRGADVSGREVPRNRAETRNIGNIQSYANVVRGRPIELGRKAAPAIFRRGAERSHAGRRKHAGGRLASLARVLVDAARALPLPLRCCNVVACPRLSLAVSTRCS